VELKDDKVARVKAVLLFRYYEVYHSGPEKLKTIEIVIDEKKTSLKQGSIVSFSLAGDAFFAAIVDGVPANVANLKHRRLDNVRMKFIAAGQDLNTFIDVSKPSNTSNQEKHSFTNIENGIGLFSSRSTVNWKEASGSFTPTLPEKVNIDDPTIEYLGTLGLDFCHGTVPGQKVPCP